jgi:hypothetical protein
MNLQNLHQRVLGANGRELFGLGGTRSYRQHESRGYHVSLEWIEGEPAMVIWPSRAGGDMDIGAFAICLSSAAVYADPSGKPTEECFIRCAMALPDMGKAMLHIELNTLVDVVMQFMPDLLAMPPAPRAVRAADKGEALWEITQQDQNGKTISEATV